MNPFEDLIRALGIQMGLALKVDSHQSCLLRYPDGLTCQIELTGGADEVMLGSFLGELPPGPFRDKALIQAMQVNGLTITPRGILAFSPKKGGLILFMKVPLSSLTGEKLHHLLMGFVAHAGAWYSGIKGGVVPTIEEESAAAPKTGHPGLRP